MFERRFDDKSMVDPASIGVRISPFARGCSREAYRTADARSGQRPVIGGQVPGEPFGGSKPREAAGAVIEAPTHKRREIIHDFGRRSRLVAISTLST